ncbi:pyridoxal-dependent decarboxylase, exosortase A system-associated [Noviherbaspirillum pedocola]|uniref:Pyridoxal-dependent decarboxylase, exosortase A system-associated n=1 Tax=Noviherbaspirillum pedocola TaxID=2801341 RepID=A0A934W5T9_9BURK|nr:pyridoxal-dependent decarboxylase, exosortase A system-associated [Noviherbaspirillum pedocola]MBK4734320.1 pyridoxal-dependent decarboxylase, exosortase A system-associated [Noviherbaspirillum pedocola]
MNSNRPVHTPQRHFQAVDGCLMVGGMPLTRLAERVGSTPFFAYDRSVIKKRVAELRAALPAAIELHFSVKANPMPAVVQLMSGLVDGFDVASASELRVALDTTMPAGEISFAGPGKLDAELAQAIAAGVVLSLESPNEARRAAAIGDRLGLTPRVLLRVNPDFEMKSSGMKMGGGAKQFGVDAEAAPQLLREIGAMGLDFHGLQIFSGSQSLSAETIVDAQRNTFELAQRLAEHAPAPIALLNIGGGFGIPYFPGEAPLDLAPVSEQLAAMLPRISDALPGTRVAIELGRYLVGEAGIYVTRITDRKVSRGQVFLVTDGGMNHHLAASGNLGQVIRKNYPVAIGNRMAVDGEGAALETVSVVGPLCTPLDTLADRMPLPHADVGDLVVVFQSGAYGPSASPANFLSRQPAAEVLV